MAKKYHLQPEHEARLSEWRDLWIRRAMRTAPMTDDDREAMRGAIRGLYLAANLTPPPDRRIIFVSSPFVAAFAGGIAAAMCNRLTGAQARDATAIETWAAAGEATRDATEAVTLRSTWAATRLAMWDATWAATSVCTIDPMRATTWLSASLADWGGITAATVAATRSLWDETEPPWALETWTGGARVHEMWNGGNQYAGFAAHLSFFRHVCGLPLDYSKWQHYETAAIHGGPRVMHAQFCLVSDFPTRICIDAEPCPHVEDNQALPVCQWIDGTVLFRKKSTA
jgi:hypothetical protein